MWFDEALEMIRRTEGDVGLLVKNLRTGETFSHNADMVFPSASVIKIPILITLLDAARAGTLSLSAPSPVIPGDVVGGSGIIQVLSGGLAFTLFDHATMMIDLSDNTATNQLLSVLGIDAVNETLRGIGTRDTVLRRRMMDFEARARGEENYTSCRDQLLIFEYLYENAERYALALKLLRQQMLNGLLPAKLAEHRVEFAHKTGSLDGVRNDVGIMYLGDPIFVAFFSKNLVHGHDGDRLAGDIGHLVYRAFIAQQQS